MAASNTHAVFDVYVADMRSYLKSRRRIAFMVWLLAIVVLLVYEIFTGTPHDEVTNLSILLCVASTLLFWIFRRHVASEVERWRIRPPLKFIAIGSLSAVWVETVFWFIETIFGITGVAASHNLAIDLLLTMPWYVIMVSLLWKVESTYHYSLFELLLLGGIYEFFADGLLGGTLGGRLSLPFIPLLIFFIPAFVMVYSVIVLPPSLLAKPIIVEFKRDEKRSMKRYLFGMLPVIGLVPYVLFLLLFLWR